MASYCLIKCFVVFEFTSRRIDLSSGQSQNDKIIKQISIVSRLIVIFIQINDEKNLAMSVFVFR